jgi:ankyrin repeat protein
VIPLPLLSLSFFLYPSLLLHVALGGETETLRILLAHGGDIEQKDKCGKTPLYICAQVGKTATLQILINSGADIHTPMQPMVGETGSDSDDSDSSDDSDAIGPPPVWSAAFGGHTEAVHMLLKAGANAQTESDLRIGSGVVGGTLHIAAQKGHLSVVRILVESWPLDRRPWKMFLMGSGAESELRDYLAPPTNHTTRNYLPILYKPEMMEEIWKYLHKPRYVDPGLLDGLGSSAAQIAAQHGHRDIVEVLQKLGVDVGLWGEGDTDDFVNATLW